MITPAAQIKALAEAIERYLDWRERVFHRKERQKIDRMIKAYFRKLNRERNCDRDKVIENKPLI